MTDKFLFFEERTTTILKIDSLYLLSMEMGNEEWNDTFQFHEFHLYSKQEAGRFLGPSSLDIELKVRNHRQGSLGIPYQKWMHRLQDSIMSVKLPSYTYKVGNNFSVFGLNMTCVGMFISVVEYDEHENLNVKIKLDYFTAIPFPTKEEENDLVHQ